METDLEEFSRRIAQEAREVQAEVVRFRLASNIAGSTEATGSTGSIESALGRIENRLTQVQAHTGILLQRMPENISLLLAELKEVILERIDSLKRASTGSTRSTESDESVGSKDDLHNKFLQRLTPREQSLLKVCFGTGLITYKEVAQRLGITPTSAKNIVNRIFQNTDKRRFFRKTCTSGIARIGVDKMLEKRILRGSQKNTSKGKKIISVIEE